MTFLYNAGLLAMSGLLLFLTGEGRAWRDWWAPPLHRGRQFIRGFVVMALLCVAYYGIVTLAGGMQWSVADNLPVARLMASGWYDLNSVLFEELLFRGAILHLLLLRLPAARACLLSAAGFGLYHWFTQGVWGNPVGMALVFLVTGLMGYALATAYVRTASIALPFGLHLGWNLVNHNLFSAGPFGSFLLIPESPVPLSGPAGLLSLLLYFTVPLLVLFLIRRHYPERAVVG